MSSRRRARAARRLAGTAERALVANQIRCLVSNSLTRQRIARGAKTRKLFRCIIRPGRSKRGLKSGRPDRISVWRSKNSRSVRAAASSLRSVVPASDGRLCRLRSVLGASASLFYSQPSRNSGSATQAQEIVSAQAPSDTPGGGRIADEKLQKVGELS